MSNKPRPREIASYSFMVVFANDGVLDEKELAFIKNLALQDGVVDDEERHVLSNIFARAEQQGMDPEVQAEVEAFKQEWGIP